MKMLVAYGCSKCYSLLLLINLWWLGLCPRAV